MSPWQMILLRAFALTMGRFGFGQRLLRRALVWRLIDRRPKDGRYMASSRFFDPRDLG